MGWNILRRKVLIFDEVKFKCRFVVSFLILLGSITWAQEEGRPMRTVPPDPSCLISDSSFFIPHSSFQRAPNSLLSDYAIRQPLTQHYIRQYSNQHGIATLNAVLSRGSIYLPFIRDEVAKRGLPPELREGQEIRFTLLRYAYPEQPDGTRLHRQLNWVRVPRGRPHQAPEAMRPVRLAAR